MRIFQVLLIALVSSSAVAQQVVPLEVPVTSPRGLLAGSDQAQTIIATFNQPMVALSGVPTDQASGPMELTPNVRGKYRWMGTATLTFSPEEPLSMATGYRVRIPAGTRALSGATLAQDVVWNFETPRPLVVRTWPFQTQQYVEPDHTILLRFNQPVDPQAVAPFCSILQVTPFGESTFPLFKASRPTGQIEGERSHYVLLDPVEPFELGSKITLVCTAGLIGTQGPLPMLNEFTLQFTVYDQLCFVRAANAQRFNPNESLHLIFTNRVSPKKVASLLRLEPSLPLPPTWDDEYEYMTNEIWLPYQFQPDQTYQATLLPGVEDQYGQRIADTVRFSFSTGSYPPSVRMTTGQGILEAYAAHRIPVTFTNIDSVRLDLGRVDPERIVDVMQRMNYDFYQRLAWDEAVLEWMDTRPEAASQFHRSMIWRPGIPWNSKGVRPVELDSVLGRSGRGVVLVQIDNLLPDQNRRRYLKTLVQVTDMGITAKFSPEHTLVWVTNLKDASPIVGATVELRSDDNKILWKGTTDAQGLVKTAGWGRYGNAERRVRSGEWEGEGEYEREPRQWVIVKHGDDVAFSSSEWNDGIEPWMFNVSYDWSPQADPLEATLLTDRGLYKAGESVEMKGIVRVRRGGAWQLPKKERVRLVIRDSRNDELLTITPKLNAFGSFAVSVPLRATAPTGYYQMQLEEVRDSSARGNARSIAYGSFRVEAFRAAEFEVTATLPGKDLVLGDAVRGQFSARYLFGGAMKNAPVRWRLSMSRSWMRPEGFDQYQFNILDWLTRTSRPSYQLLTSGDTVLNESGSLGIRFPLAAGSAVGPQSVMLEAEVTSPSRQVIAGRTSVQVHGAEYSIGIAPSTSFLQTDSALTCRFIAVSVKNKLIPNQRLTVRLYQRVWRSVRKAETGGRYRWESVVENILKDSSIVVTKKTPVETSYRPKEAGLYFFEATAKDKRGNEVVTNAYFYVTGSSYVAWERKDEDRIELVTDKEKYQPGDVARVLVKSPYEKAPALVSIEREGILRQYTTTLVGSAPQLEIPIAKDDLPNVFVSVVLLQGRVEGVAATREADVGRPSFKIGYASLSISPEERRLRIEVRTERKEYRPGDTVSVTLKSVKRDGTPVPAELALSVADLGVLNLIGYRMADPFRTFYAERGLAVRTTESRIHLIQQRNYDEKGEDPGGGGMEMAAKDAVDAEGVRKDFRPSAYWNPSIITNAEGIAVVTFKLPDNLTSFQLMAVGQTTSSEFGYGESDLRVSKPLLLQPSLPRFVRVGDSFEGGVVAINHSNKRTKVTLVTKVEGLSARGKDTVTFALAPGESREVRSALAAERVGTAVFTFRATSENDADGLQWKIPVIVPRTRETVALYESTVDARKREQLQIPRDIHRDIGSVEFTAASTAMVGLAGGVSYLFDYPYGCLEQRVSRVLPLIAARELVEAFKLEPLKGKDYRQVVERMLDEIPQFQRWDGGFAYWKNTDETWPYLSAFTMYALIRAKQNGYAVSDRVLEEGYRYLRDVLDGRYHSTLYSKEVWYCTHAFAVYALAVKGSPDFGHMERMYREREQMPLFARAYLLRALHAAKGNRAMIDELVRDLMNKAKVAPTTAHFEESQTRGMYWAFHSNTRTTALILHALVESQPENAIFPKLVRWLLEARRKGCWRTTQENLYVVDALAAYFRAYEKEEPRFTAELQLAGGTALQAAFEGRSLTTARKSLPIGELQLGVNYPIDVIKTGPGRLYYGVRMQYYPKAEAAVREEGITVTRELESASRDKSGTDIVKSGAVVRIRLTVATAQDRSFIVVEDPVPAGFEIVQASFRTEATMPPDEQGRDEWWWRNPFRHREFNDDKALFFADYLPAGVHSITYMVRATGIGNFGHPGVHAEGMYEPEVFGQGMSGKLRIE